ncbi:hypothetical protein XM38_033540 [Halomicronema hongdechloris C2206]|uniref:Uncharacterized protein n=1 Tax=Halomicronema hongdechloris C2206 TaxID=1641165 RepID=A0A1Z3HQJ0_9CYAN|nr:hypothetical protein [Halomicronema hongdechloris]ASC72397.1 hypothetical protein XM38_033540 [Halomicronema hongdechloris C2206]
MPPRQEQQLERLRRAVLKLWWMGIAVLWLTVGLLSLWGLRHEIERLVEYFTWVEVRYGLAYNRGPAIGLGLCVGLTLALLITESRHILWGLSRSERQRLTRLLDKIQRQGPHHPLWRWVMGKSPKP